MDGKLLLQRRAIQPGMGKWSFPSGYVDRGEVMAAAVREVLGETGVRVALDRLVGLYSYKDNPVVLAVYSGHWEGGTPRPSDHEVHEVGLFAPDDLTPWPSLMTFASSRTGSGSRDGADPSCYNCPRTSG